MTCENIATAAQLASFQSRVEDIQTLFHERLDSLFDGISEIQNAQAELAQGLRPLLDAIEGANGQIPLVTQLEKMSDALGANDYPIELPASLTQENELATTVDSIPKFLSWLTRQIDALVGQFPVKIKIEDTDLIQVGEQGLDLNFPNLAEMLAELFGMVLSTRSLSDANMNIALRNLHETGSVRLLSIQNHYLIEAITEYLGYQTSKKKIAVPFTYNPLVTVAENDDEESSEKLSDALRPTELDLEIEEMTDKVPLARHLQVILEAARIIKAVHWQKIDTNGEDCSTAHLEKNQLASTPLILRYSISKESLTRNLDLRLYLEFTSEKNRVSNYGKIPDRIILQKQLTNYF